VKRGQDAEHNSTNLCFSGGLSIVDKDSDIIDLVSDSVTNTVSDTESIDNNTLSSPLLFFNPNKQRHSTISQEQLCLKCKEYKFNSHAATL
jgi:hypothetical protein